MSEWQGGLPEVDGAPIGDGHSCLVQIFGPGLGRKIALDRETMTVGRDASTEIVLRLDQISRAHCAFISRDGRVILRDLASTNGTFLNDRELGKHEEVELRTGDQVQVGPVIFKFLYGGEVEALYHEEIYQSSVQDPLTRLYGRRYLREHLERELARTQRHARPFSLILIGVDHFKSIGECFGHLGSDFVLREISNLLHEHVRKEDCCARFGGCEIAVACAESDLEHTVLFAEKLRGVVEVHEFVYEGEHIPVTISVGVAAVGPVTASPSELVSAAEELLYQAQRAGRNQIES